MNGSTVKQLFVIALIEQQRHFAYNKNKSNNNCRKFFGEVVNRKYKRKPTRGFVQVKVCVNNKAVSIFVSKKKSKNLVITLMRFLLIIKKDSLKYQ